MITLTTSHIPMQTPSRHQPLRGFPAVWGMAVLATAAVLAAAPAHAGRACDERKPVTAQVIERGMALAAQTSQALDAENERSGATVVLIGRAGQDLSKYGLRYSHFGWAYKTAEGPWRVAHKLNECGTAVGHVYRQGLGEFFWTTCGALRPCWPCPAPLCRPSCCRCSATTAAPPCCTPSPTAWSVMRGAPSTSSPTSGRWRPWPCHGARHRAHP